MKMKKVAALLVSSLMVLSVFAGCGSSKDSDGAKADTKTTDEKVDPLEAITDGYYSYTYAVDGMDDYCGFLHFYEEKPVVGSVFYANFAYNNIAMAGTYKVEKKDCESTVFMSREEATKDGAKAETKTLPYTITFYDFSGNELDSCGFDGNYVYNDTKSVTGTGCENVAMKHDNDKNSKYLSTYEDYETKNSKNVMSFVSPDDESCTVNLKHNGRYEDMMDIMVEGEYTLEEADDGSINATLTPDSDSDTAATLAITADKTSATYTPDGGEAVELQGVADVTEALYKFVGTSEIPGMGKDADVVVACLPDGTVKATISAFDVEMDIDSGTYEAATDGTVTIHFDASGDQTSEGTTLHFACAGTPIGDLDLDLELSNE